MEFKQPNFHENHKALNSSLTKPTDHTLYLKGSLMYFTGRELSFTIGEQIEPQNQSLTQIITYLSVSENL